MVLMPEAYYAATILQQKIYQPCTVPPTDNMYVPSVGRLKMHDLKMTEWKMTNKLLATVSYTCNTNFVT